MKQNRKQSTLAIALVFVGSVTLAAFMWPKSHEPTFPISSPLDPHLGVAESEYLKSAELRNQENHPVTNEMVRVANSLGQKKAPNFQLSDGTGETFSLKSLTADDKPLLIFFIEKKCPCCLGAKHFVDRLADNFKGTATVIGVINASGKEAQTWRQLTQPHFKVLEDPNQEVIRAYAAERGVYTSLISPDGTIDKAYPGYSIETLKDISARLSRWANVKDPGFESNAAPKELTSGCLFPEPEEKTNKQS